MAPRSTLSKLSPPVRFALATLTLFACHPTPKLDPIQEARVGLAARTYLPPREGDLDADGLSDEEEATLAERYAPVVTLEKDDWTRPASAKWLRDRVSAPHGGYSTEIRRGSTDPADWTTYVHVFATRGGEAIHIQYWFFYPHNDGPLFFNHEADWEHITVTLDKGRKPLGVAAARHSDSAPGKWRDWSRLRKLDGTHPEILSASGSHASYFDPSDARFYDSVGQCPDLEGPCQHPRWLTWKSGGLVNLGERHTPQEPTVTAHAGKWGSAGWFPGTDAPRGPALQRGWCVPLDAACFLLTEARLGYPLWPVGCGRPRGLRRAPRGRGTVVPVRPRRKRSARRAMLPLLEAKAAATTHRGEPAFSVLTE